MVILINVFGIYAIIDGAIAIYEGITHRQTDDTWLFTILIGIAGIIAGVLALLLPITTAVALLYLIAAWLVVSGAVLVWNAIQVRKEITGEFFLILTGVLSVLLGVVFFIFPGRGILSLIWWLGLWAIVAGIFLILFSFRVRGLADTRMEP